MHLPILAAVVGSVSCSAYDCTIFRLCRNELLSSSVAGRDVRPVPAQVTVEDRNRARIATRWLTGELQTDADLAADPHGLADDEAAAGGEARRHCQHGIERAKHRMLVLRNPKILDHIGVQADVPRRGPVAAQTNRQLQCLGEIATALLVKTRPALAVPTPRRSRVVAEFRMRRR